MYRNIFLGFEFEIEGQRDDISNFIESTEHITGIKDKYVYEYHKTKHLTKEGKWRIEEDDSIRGAEFISPPYRYYKAKELCKKFLNAIKNCSYVKTTKNCGLHVGMSVNGGLDSVNLAELLPNINARLLASLWPDRTITYNTFCRSLQYMLEDIDTEYDYVKKGFDTPELVSNWLAEGHSFIKIRKYNNTSYLELRVPGGQDYHLKFDELFTTINHVSNILLGRIKTTKKQISKKMYSYLNRAYKQQTENEEIVKSVKDISKTNKQGILRTCFAITHELEFATYRNIHIDTINKKLNHSNYIYQFIKHLIQSIDTFDCSEKDSVYNFLDLVSMHIDVVIPEKEQQVEMLKLLKIWNVLPLFLSKKLINRLNQRTCKYFAKYYLNKAKDPTKYKTMLYFCKNSKGGKECLSMNTHVLNAEMK